MSVREAFEKHKSLISRIEETIIPLQEQKLWNDDKFFTGVKDMLTSGNITEHRIIDIVSKALFNLKQSQPAVEDVKKLVKAFPGALKRKDSRNGDLITIQTLLTYYRMENGKYEYEMGLYGTQYISALALEGMKDNVGGVNMRGGLLDDVYKDILIQNSEINMLQCLALYNYGGKSLNALKDLRRDELLMKQDIVGQSLLFCSSFAQSEEKIEYMMSWDPDALCNTRVSGSPLLHAIVNSIATNDHKQIAFTRCLKFSLKYKRSILFQKDQNGKTALKLALETLGEKLVMTMLKEIFTESSGYPLLHHVLLQEPKCLNLFVKYFPNLYHLRDEHGQTLTQTMFAKKRDYLEENPMLWMNLSSDQLEEKDPYTTLRPFAAVASGDEGKLDLSFSILRKHPSVLDVIWEERVKMTIGKKGKKRNAEESSEHCKRKKVREAPETTS